MPSYADEIAARHPQVQGRSSSGPVRLTISRGDSKRGSDGRLAYEERWEEEEIMDIESVSSTDNEIDRHDLFGSQRRDEPLTNFLRQRLLQGNLRRTDESGCSLLVLDTNILLSALPLVRALFSQSLKRSLSTLTAHSSTPSPVALVIPHIVLSELDNLKSSSRNNVASQARAANAWLLSSLQAQKRQMYDVICESATLRRERIPENSWILHVENTSHADALERAGGSHTFLSPDEEIIRLCVSLTAQASVHVYFCSEDVNARARAEIEGLSTFSFKDILQGVDDSEEEMVKLADELIEQWDAQSQTGSDGRENPEERMDEDEEQVDIAPTKRRLPAAVQKSDRVTRSSKLQSVQHSMHAVSTGTSGTSIRKGILRSNALPSSLYDKQKRVHHYPDDRSSSSSMWALKR